MNFKQIVASIISEELVAGGSSSVFGQGVNSTATQFSGDNYAKGDNRLPYSIFGGAITRNGLKRKHKNLATFKRNQTNKKKLKKRKK